MTEKITFEIGDLVGISFDSGQQIGIIASVDTYNCKVLREKTGFDFSFPKGQLRHITELEKESILKSEALSENAGLSKHIEHLKSELEKKESCILSLKETIVSQAEALRNTGKND